MSDQWHTTKDCDCEPWDGVIKHRDDCKYSRKTEEIKPDHSNAPYLSISKDNKKEKVGNIVIK